MLDADTRRRIDTARDILVGKVPDPKSQVEQITIALIYKFMDDIDAEAEELGGQRRFFAGDFARYGWPRLVRAGLGGHEVLSLYADAITRMPENPGIPALFRDIFNNAYLPYRDPETLRAFLKVIDTFTYDHSERLGDAFEYLLSVLGSQGDAGQFRTPRHIIDFIVDILDPKKGETVLDPACGTAGFLVSSYKHILKANTDAEGHSTLTPDEKGKLAVNFKGYDISPDMVRLSLVNLYLHGFVEPHIVEYDTLTSEERWNEYADVILANPPFMSPKGGIRPHRRFSVHSKRSEVLFVDYMAEHLTPSGRAGIIVPEGIIFQSQTAHKLLRKMLVDSYLVAVISLPAGVFQPYSGVKTSILILDKALAKKTDHLAFFKVQNDGFDLGAQRRAIDENDLPQVAQAVGEYLNMGAREGQDQCAESYPSMLQRLMELGTALIVEKGKIAANGECDLSGERYRRPPADETKYEWVELSDVIASKPQYGSGARKVPYDNKVRYVRITDIAGNGQLKSDDLVSPSVIEPDLFLEPNDLLIARSGSVGRTYIHEDVPGICQFAGYLIRFRVNPSKAVPRYVYHVTKSDSWREWILSNSKTGTLTNINAKQYSAFRFPLPPLEVQREIVAEIAGYQRVIDGARAVIENYRPQIVIDPEWPMVKVADICKRLQYGLSAQLNIEERGFKTFRMNELVEGKCVDSGDMKRADVSAEHFEKYRLFRGDILFNRTNSFEHVGRTGVFDLDGAYCFASYLIRVSISEASANPFYVNAFMNTERFQNGIKRYATRAIGQSNINATSLAAYPIPLPPIATQNEIVAEIQAEQTSVDANRELIERLQNKILVSVERVWR